MTSDVHYRPDPVGQQDYEIQVEGAKGMTSDAVGKVTFRLKELGFDLRDIKKLILDQRELWVAVIFHDGREAIVADVLEAPGGRRIYSLPH